MTKPEFALALDFGGTKLATAVVFVPDGSLLGYQKVRTPADSGAQASLELILNTAEKSLKDSGIPREKITGGGISFGGPVSPDGKHVIRSMHIKGWENYPLAKVAAEHFGFPFRMGNDGNVAALGEWFYGSRGEPHYFMYIQISTGIGGGFILNGEILQGQGMAGEVGHQKVQYVNEAAFPCACGSKGCIEAVASGWALARDAKSLIESTEDCPVFREQVSKMGEISAKPLIQAARRGDPSASDIVDYAFKCFALSLSNAIVLFDLEEIVIGGGVAVNSWDLLEPILTHSIPEFLPTEMRGKTKIRMSSLNGTETLLGAAKLSELAD
ncbi:MAG TPA: ROK family protein [Flexilinea sp.]|nr:ROK family protein [Flexilinea sp.]HOW07955.1 ROK family protein [Flexilinea sp.]